MSALQDKVILITGGTSGIGKACTEYFARLGARVVAMSIQETEGQHLARRLTGDGFSCLFHLGDVSEEADVKAARELTPVEQGGVGERLGRMTGKKVRCKFSVDESLIGGMVTRIGSTIYDGSVRGQLDALRRRLTE